MRTLIEQRLDHSIGQQALPANVGDLKNVLTNVKISNTYGEVQLALLLEQGACCPIDSKFPREDYDHLQEAIAAGEAKLTAQYRRDLQNKIRGCAKDISAKYINPPHTE
jgi:DNA recombination protein RmuC